MKKGSALLVVLGMMAFIIVSAVAFSAYMRHSRLPSSYLRRTSASRLLVKAAIAEAIETVDASIGNNPYPGVGSRTSQLPRQDSTGGYSANRNHWRQRVLMCTNQMVSASDTVSALTLEGLAYVPPPFINEVRYYSRHTPTAEWQSMNYDAGRFAFCAVDVSDCFDVNRLMADVGRDSSDAGRITLAHCFENPEHTGYSVQPSVWDSFMDNYLDDAGNKVPLISVADLVLALNRDKPSGVPNPFCSYLEQKKNAMFVTSDSESREPELLRNMAFVTDSYFPVTNSANAAVVDLSRVSDQPFYGMRMAKADDLTKNADTFDQLVEMTNAKFKNLFDIPEIVQLYDYLDRDSIPLSLALPTVERVPMVTGAALNCDISLIVPTPQKSDPIGVGTPNPDTGEYEKYVRVTVGELKLAGEIRVAAGFVHPFKYSRGTQPSFKAQVAATVTLVPAGEEKNLRRAKAKAPAVYVRDDWTTSARKPTSAKYKDEKVPVVFTMQSAPKQIKFTKTSVTEEEDAVLEDVTFDFGVLNESLTAEFENSAVLNGVPLDDKFKKGTFRRIETLDAKKVMQSETFETVLRPSNAEMNDVTEMEDGKKYVPVVQLWIRVLDKNNKVVDLVPASFRDDETQSQRLTDIRSAALLPVLRFYDLSEDAAAIVKDKSVLDLGSKALKLYPAAYLADDPRFNHAPENLKACETFGGDFKTEWMSAQRSKSRDGDIFMTTSDAGYMQSLFEMSFVNVVDIGMVDSASYNGNVRTAFEQTPANAAMWKTYSQIKVGSSNGGEITDVLPAYEGGRGFRVNPFTGDVNVMMAALANTPLDWWAASTNDIGDVIKQGMVGNLAEANKYTFSKHSGAQMQVEHGKRSNSENTLMQLAKNMMSAFRSRGDGNWQAEFDNLDWKSEDKIGGVDLGVTLHTVDKKFLHGFWRGCFANRQHLFLIFARAEPMMMGGGGLGQTPPQLGARAVALVWRDPTPTETDPSGQPRPHRTRVLFYRQFE